MIGAISDPKRADCTCSCSQAGHDAGIPQAALPVEVGSVLPGHSAHALIKPPLLLRRNGASLLTNGTEPWDDVDS